jgi:hypothetical protein
LIKKLATFVAATLVALTIPASAQVIGTTQKSITVALRSNISVAGSETVTATVSCKNLNGGGTSSANIYYTGTAESTIGFPLVNNSAGPGSSCKINVASTNLNNAIFQLDFAGQSTQGVGNVSTISTTYPDGYVPVWDSTKVFITLRVPSFNVEVIPATTPGLVYTVDCFNGATKIGTVVVTNGASRKVTSSDFHSLNSFSLCNVNINLVPSNKTVLWSTITEQVGSAAIHIKDVPAPTIPTTVPTTAAPTTTTSAPTTIYVAPAPVTVVKCFRVVKKKLRQVVCPK